MSRCASIPRPVGPATGRINPRQLHLGASAAELSPSPAVTNLSSSGDVGLELMSLILAVSMRDVGVAQWSPPAANKLIPRGSARG